MSEIQLSVVSDYIGVKVGTLRYWIKINEKIRQFFHKKTIVREEFLCGKTRQRIREMWFADSSKLEELKEIASKRKVREKKRFDKKYSWSRSAIECWQAQYDCKKCQNNYICSAFIKRGIFPPMQKIVKEMVERYGIPPERIIEND